MLKALLNILFYTLFLIGISWPVQSQNIVHFNGQNFEEYKLDLQARQMLVDSRGFLWIGTANGITRYDGYNFVFYKENPLDSSGFQGQFVNDIFEDKEGGLWVGSDHGVNYLAPSEKAFVHFHFDVSRILSIFEDQSGTIWMTSPQTVVRIAHGTIEKATHITSSEEGIYFYRLLITHDQRILISGNGLYEIQVKDENEISVSTLIQGRYISNMAETDDGTLLMCSDSGYFVLRKGKQIVENKLDRENTRNGQLHLDETGYLWFVHDWGIVRVRLDEDYKPVERNRYRTGYMRSITEDRSGNLFFGKGDGILKLGWNYNQFQFISLPDAFRNSYAFNFLEDDEGKLWIGTFDGLLVFDYAERNYEVYKGNLTNLKTVPHSSIYGSLKDKSSALWFATGNGVVKYDFNTKDFLRVSAGGLSHNLIEDNEGNIWFISENRLFSIDHASLKAIQIESIDGVNISPEKIYQDRTNTFWIWDNKKGLLSYSLKNRVLNGDGQSALIEAGVKIPRLMKEDKMGQLWITFTHGVYIIDLQTRKIVRFMNTTNSPLLNDDAFGIACDQSGNIWLKQHPYGSICINPKTFEVIGYNPNWLYSGLFGEKGRQPASVVAAGEDGKLFADGHGDFCIFYPDSLRINKFPPSLVLQEFRVNEKLIEDRSTFQSFENNINLVFCGIHFDNPNRNHYAYFLEGYDHVWSTPGKIREARYSNLPSGTFKFFLKAANSDGVWSEPTLLSTFTILPVWWQTKIAFATYLLLLMGLIIMFYRIKLAQRLAQAETQKLKEIDDFKNQFFTNITHEFRTPLTVITGVAEKIEGKSGVLIKRNAEQLLTLINQILELSKIEANATKLNPEPVEMNQFLKYLLQSFSSLADEKLIALNFESEINQLYTVLDKTKFTLIIQNLLINAVKFTPQNGSITVAISSNVDQFQIQIRDTGIGIDAIELPFIFNRFYQANNQMEDTKGSGIGLAITKELVELMKGEISVMSEKGRGTIFKITLPVHQPAITIPQQMDKPEERLIEKTEEKLNILLIEDNEDVATLIQDILSEQFEVVRTVNGRVGVDKAIEYIPDLIISDVMMPEMNGLEVTQHLKADLRTSHIPIILLTAKADLDSRLSGLAQGADIYLVKPFHTEELLLHIQNLIRLRETLRQRYSEGPFVLRENAHPEDAFVSKLQASLYAHLADDTFGIEEICREMGVSRTQLHRKLKALTGKSASLYIRDLRLAEGKKLLLQNTSTIAGVAYAIGFSDPNYFSRLYSEKYGHSPIEERKK